MDGAARKKKKGGKKKNKGANNGQSKTDPSILSDNESAPTSPSHVASPPPEKNHAELDVPSSDPQPVRHGNNVSNESQEMPSNENLSRSLSELQDLVSKLQVDLAAGVASEAELREELSRKLASESRLKEELLIQFQSRVESQAKYEAEIVIKDKAILKLQEELESLRTWAKGRKQEGLLDVALSDKASKLEASKDGRASDEALVKAEESVASLRAQLEKVEQEKVLATVNEAGAQAETARLREENAKLAAEAGQLRDTVERLEGERKQAASKLAAVQTGMQQLEREASIRSRARADVDTAAALAAEGGKGWLGWAASKDPVGEAMAVAEEARVQKAAATAMSEKLLAENAELADRVNEQAALIDRLAKKYSRLAGGYEHYETEDDISRAGTPSTAEGAPLKSRRPSVAPLEQIEEQEKLAKDSEKDKGPGLALEGKEEIGESVEKQLGRPKSKRRASIGEVEARTGFMHPILQEDEGVGSPVSAPNRRKDEDSLHSERVGVREALVQSVPNAADSVEKLGESEQEGQLSATPFSDAPISGAPIRLVSWFTRFVSGADLVGK